MSMFNKVTKTFQWGQHTVTLETGEIARQAGGAVVVDIDDTVVLATVVAAKNAKPGQDFFPLTVDYIEKTYAAGKIPGSFFKREGRPSELETLTSRLIDRPIRPLFPEGFYNEVQVVIHVLSLNPEVAGRHRRDDRRQRRAGDLRHPVQRPDRRRARGLHQRPVRAEPDQDRSSPRSQLDLVVAGTEAAVLMVESEAQQLTEEVMLGARGVRPRAGQGRDRRDPRTGARGRQAGVGLAAAGQGRGASSPRSPRWPKRSCAPPTRSAASRPARRPLREAYASVHGRAEGRRRRASTRSRSTTCCSTSKRRSCAARSWPASRASTAATRAPCARSRSAPACCRAPTARRCSRAARRRRWSSPRSAPTRDAQRIDALAGEYSDRFMLHYNMPPFATGETGRVGSPKRREIGHGRLAKRALVAVLPTDGRVPVLDARGLGDHRVERLLVDGLGVRRLPGADGRRRADEGARRRHRDGPDQGRQPLRRADRHPRRRGSPRRHGLQGGRHRPTASPRCRWTSRSRASPRRSCRSRWRRPRKRACTSWARCRRRWASAKTEVSQLRAAPVHDEDQPGEDPRRDRQGRRGHPRADRGDRHARSTSTKTARSPSPRPTPTRPTYAQEAHRGDHRRSRGRQDLRRPGHQDPRLRRARATCCPARTACCTSARSRTSASRRSPTT